MPNTLKKQGVEMGSPEMSAKQRRLYLWIGQDLYEQFVEGAESRADKISRLFHDLVSKAFEKPELRTKLEHFYQEHWEFFDQEEANKRVNLNVTELTVAFAKPVAFDILGTGNVSLLFRILLRHYAVQRKLVERPLRSEAPVVQERFEGQRQAMSDLKRKTLKPAPHGSIYQNHYKTPVSVRTICTVNAETEALINRLAMKLGKKKMELLRDLIEETFTPGEEEKLLRFYRKQPNQFGVDPGTGIPLRLNLTTQINALLDLLSIRMFDEQRNNRSKAIRVMVAYFAKKYRATPAKK